MNRLVEYFFKRCFAIQTLQRESEASGLDESFGPSGVPRVNRPGSECSARVLADALSKIALSNEADTQSILGKFVAKFQFLPSLSMRRKEIEF